MEAPVFVSEQDPDGWADAIAMKFIHSSDALLKDIQTYPMKHRFWSHPRHFWNRSKAIRRAWRIEEMGSDNLLYFRAFKGLYSSEMSNPEEYSESMKLVNELMATLTKHARMRMGSFYT